MSHHNISPAHPVRQIAEGSDEGDPKCPTVACRQEWIDIAGQDVVIEGRGRLVRARGLDIALFSVDGRLHALEDSCPHAGGSLSGGRVEGNRVACPAHGLRFDLASGCMRGAAGLQTKVFPVRLRDGRVEIQLDAASPL